MTMSDTNTTTKPRTYRTLLADTARKHYGYILATAVWLVAINLALNTILTVHLTVYQFSIFDTAAFANVELWMVAADSLFWVWVLYAAWQAKPEAHNND